MPDQCSFSGQGLQLRVEDFQFLIVLYERYNADDVKSTSEAPYIDLYLESANQSSRCCTFV